MALKISSPFVYKENLSGEGSFTKTGDAYAVDERLDVYAVADAPLRRLTKLRRRYPFDDHGGEVAQLLCDEFVHYIQAELGTGTFGGEKTVHEALVVGNKAIRQLNLRLGRDYSDKANYDFAETVGFCGVVHEDTFFYGGIEDCYVNVIRGENYDNVAPLKFRLVKSVNYSDRMLKAGKAESHFPKGIDQEVIKKEPKEAFHVGYLRNNCVAKDENGDAIGWGSFTGEPEAETFIQTGSVKLQSGDGILLFSDGMIPYLSDNEFMGWLSKNRKSTFAFQHAMRKKIMKFKGGGREEFHENGREVMLEKTLIYCTVS